MPHHQHDNPFSQRCCDLAESISGATGMPSAVLILEQAESINVPHFAFNGNTTDLASMVRAMLESGMKYPRPTDCALCARNWDLMAQAHAIMMGAGGSC